MRPLKQDVLLEFDMQYLTNIDRTILKWVYQKPYRQSTALKVLIFMGDGPFWMMIVFITALLGAFLNNETYYQLSILLMVVLIISNIVFVFFKTKVKRKRPYANIEMQRNIDIEIINRDPGHGSKEFESFPSGHVLWTTICVCILIYKLGLIAFLLFGWMIPAMVYLRLYLGVHYPSDVLAALALGSINVTVTLLFAPIILGLLSGYREYTIFHFGYWTFIGLFLFVGIKSWLKRV